MYLGVRILLKSISRITDPIRMGVVGLGRGFALTAPSILETQYADLIACAAPRQESRAAFAKAFDGQAYDNLDRLLDDPKVEAVHIATPHQMHADMTEICAAAGKHVLVEKPMAVTLEEGRRMVRACDRNNVKLIVGPSHSFDAQILEAKALIDQGMFGDVLAIQALNYTDFMYRPRRGEELRTEDGGGVIFSQGAHQIDVVRLLAGVSITQVFAATGCWDPRRHAEVAYQAILNFQGGITAQCTYSGYAHFDSDEWMDWLGEVGNIKDSSVYGKARSSLKGLDQEQEISEKRRRTFGVGQSLLPAIHNEHFGPLIVQCREADLRITPKTIEVYGDSERRSIRVPVQGAPRNPVFRALYQSIRYDENPIQTGQWCLDTLATCHAIIESARTLKPVIFST